MFRCEFCTKEWVKSGPFKNHVIRCPHNPSRVYKNGMQGKKGANQYSHGAICSDETRKKISQGLYGRTHSAETKSKLSVLAKQNGLGGHTSKQRLHFVKRNGEIVFLQSSYEIAFAQLLEECQIVWSRPNPLTWIDKLGVEHRYYPDFKIGNRYFDTKNSYLITRDADKIHRVSEQNNVEVVIVPYDDINIDFVQSLTKEM